MRLFLYINLFYGKELHKSIRGGKTIIFRFQISRCVIHKLLRLCIEPFFGHFWIFLLNEERQTKTNL